MLHPDDRDNIQAVWHQAVARREEYCAQGRIWHSASQDWRAFEVRATSVFDGGGAIREWVAAITDIEDSCRAEATLRDSEAPFRASQELSPVGFTIMRAVRDAEGSGVDFVWDYANPAALRLLKATQEELARQQLLERLPDNHAHPQLFPRYVCILKGELAGDEVELPYQAQGIDGWFRNAVVCIEEERIAVSFDDITAKKRAEEAQAAELAALHQLQTVSTRLVREDGIEPILDLILDAAQVLTNAHCASI